MTGTHVPLLRSDLYEIAYLAGGPRRVVETAVVALVENGRLRVDRATGRLHVVDASRRHPVEAVVLDAVGPRGRSVWGLVWRARSDPRLATVADGRTSRPTSASVLARLHARIWSGRGRPGLAVGARAAAGPCRGQ